MNTVSRKYPRAAIDEPGVMTVRASDPKHPARRLSIAIRSISCEGAGLVLPEGRFPLERRSTVTMDFRAGGHRFEIPGVIVWVADSAASVPLDVGVRFVLAAVPNETRQAYAHWIVDLLQRRGVTAQAPAHR